VTRFESLLLAKLLPPAPSALHLDRPRLSERLAAGLAGKATAIVAGPGYGKTTLVARFLEARGEPSVWYALDAGDRDPWVLVRYLVHGLRDHAPELGERSEGAWTELGRRPEDVERLVDVLIRDAEESLSGPVVVVLDGVEHLEPSEPCVRALRRLLAYLPGTLHLVLIGRSMPEIGLPALRAEGKLALVEGPALLFDRNETSALLRDVFGLPIADEDIDRVHERTGGWVTALQLLRQTAALSAGAAGLSPSVFARAEAEIFDYFSEEVLAGTTDDVRRFLLESSVALVLDADICARALPGADVRGILARLTRHHVFLSALEGEGEFYAYDPLFREFLARKLRAQAGEAAVQELHRRFGRAHAERGELAPALTHALEGEDAEGVTALLDRHGRALLRSGMLDAVRSGAGFLAARGLAPRLAHDLLGEACRRAGDYAAARGHFENALAAGGEQAETLQGLAYALLKTGELADAAATAERALRAAGDADPALVALILNTLSIVRYREGRETEAIDGWQRALAHARRAGDQHLTLMIAHNLGLPHARRGDFVRASECFRLLTGPDNPRMGPEEAAAYLNLGRIATLRGDYAQAARLLGDAAEIARRFRLRALAGDILEAEGTLSRESGELTLAAERYAGARARFLELGLHHLLDNVVEEEALLASRRAAHDEARRRIDEVVERRRTAGDDDGVALALLARGEILVRAGDPAAAVAGLAESLRSLERLHRSYEACLAELWLAAALLATGDSARASASAAAAIRRASELDYGAAVWRVAALDPGLGALLRTLPGAPAGLGASASPAPPVATSRADLTVRLLGPLEVFRDPEHRIPAGAWKVKRAQQLLAFVASSRGRRASKERIIDAVWGDARPTAIERNFHPTISFLRRALNHAHHVPKNFILYETGAYLLNPAYRYDVDTERFEAGLRAARDHAAAGRTPDALAAYDAAIDLHRGPFLEDEPGAWAATPRAHFDAGLAGALADAGELQLAHGDPERGLALLERLVEREPLDEQASCRLMRAHGARGNRGAVEREFRRLSHALAKSLRTEPVVDTRRTYREALGRDVRSPLDPRR
jgi:LuxR family transcriptional regulator, maltose regulon positive regulatory protein